MKFFIPTVGMRLVLSKPWTFHLVDEYRNEKFYKAFHGEIKRTNYRWVGFDGETSPVETQHCWHQTYDEPAPIETTLPKGAVLEVDRIYLRKGAKDFDSITFRLLSGCGKVKGRFWVKLTEINNKLEFDEENTPIKWPSGRFVLSTYNHRADPHIYCKCGYYNNVNIAHNPPRCICDQNAWPMEMVHVLLWQQKPDNIGDRKGLSVAHKTTTDGKIDLIETENHYSSYRIGLNHYRKDFATIEELIAWAKKKDFTLAHVNEFEKAYKKKLKGVLFAGGLVG